MKNSSAASVDQGLPGFTFGEFRLEPDGRLLHGKTEIHLAPKELEALRLLLLHAGQIVTPAQLHQALWGDVHVSADSVPRCISSLRSRLGSEETIRAIYKRGYRLTLPVHREFGVTADLPRVAIMPFSCGTQVPEHLGQAVAEEATTRLTGARPQVLLVLARDSVFALAAQGMSAQQVGETLKADLVLTGTLKALPSHFKLRVEMVRVQDGTQIWVEDLLAGRDHVSALESELVERLLFRAGSSALPAARAEEPPAIDPQAHEIFLRGRFEWRSFDRHRMQEGLRNLRHALDLDGRLDQARTDMVHACMAQELFGYVTPSVTAEQVRRMAADTLSDSNQQEAILPALGWVAFHVDRDLPAALELFARCEPFSGDPWQVRMHVLLAASRRHFDEASSLLQRCLENDPYAPWLNAGLAWVHHLAGRVPESLKQVERCLNVAPNHTMSRLFCSTILAFNGQAKRAAALTQELASATPYFDMPMAVHAYALACDGERDHALEVLERLQWLGRERFVMRSFSAAAYLALGDGESAIGELRAADHDRCPWYFMTLADPRLEPLHGAAEFQEMRAQLDAMEDAAAEAMQDAELSGASTR